MNKVLLDKTTRESCHIYNMLAQQKTDKHFSFHTPGHKIAGWDITELSYSDNLSAPSGCIYQAETDIAQILGAYKSFILTDGSTSGVLSMIYASKALGVKTLAFPVRSHKSVYNGCELTGITPKLLDTGVSNGFPSAPTIKEVEEILEEADGILLTSPDYYGVIPDLPAIREVCDRMGKLLLIDGAHGGHLHFKKEIYAGTYADFWVDGVHKDLPALTQGAVVSVKEEKFADALQKGVDIFRTTSPSYPIMASVEYAVKYPENPSLEKSVLSFVKKHREFFSINGDWTKLCFTATGAFTIQKELEQDGFYAEFCDGQTIMFYLSPVMSKKEFHALCSRLKSCMKTAERPNLTWESSRASVTVPETAETEWVALEIAEGLICAQTCGLFPPCVPLIRRGDKIKTTDIELLKNADNVFGIKHGKILVVKE
jgi:arginine/lysine/ornithine decarboxylase